MGILHDTTTPAVPMVETESYVHSILKMKQTKTPKKPKRSTRLYWEIAPSGHSHLSKNFCFVKFSLNAVFQQPLGSHSAICEPHKILEGSQRSVPISCSYVFYGSDARSSLTDTHKYENRAKPNFLPSFLVGMGLIRTPDLSHIGRAL